MSKGARPLDGQHGHEPGSLASRLVRGRASLTPDLETVVLDAHHDARSLFDKWRV